MCVAMRRASSPRARRMSGAPWPQTGAVTQKRSHPRARAARGGSEEKLRPRRRGSGDDFAHIRMSSLEEMLQLLPGKAVQNGVFFKARPARLVNSTPDERQFARAVGVGVDGDQHARGVCFSRVLGGEVEPVRAGVDLEKAAILPRLLDDPVDFNLIARAL